MLPLRDDVPSRTSPWVTRALIVANALAFVWELSAGDRLSSFLLVPARVMEQPETILTSMFLHGGWMHLIGNMLYLHIFGDNVEDRLGHFRFLAFYIACGVGAALLQISIAPGSLVPMLGASGAIAGVLGGYLLLHPHARILTLVPGFFTVIGIPAVFYLGFWFFLQFGSGVLSLGRAGGGVAFFAHVGGFVTGLVLVKLFDRGLPRSTWQVHPRRRFI